RQPDKHGRDILGVLNDGLEDRSAAGEDQDWKIVTVQVARRRSRQMQSCLWRVQERGKNGAATLHRWACVRKRRSRFARWPEARWRGNRRTAAMPGRGTPGKRRGR